MSPITERVVERGFVDLPCEISSHRRWDGEYLVFVQIPDEPQPRQVFVNESHVTILEGRPSDASGAKGLLRAPIAPDASRLSDDEVVVGLPGDPLSGGHWISLDKQALDSLNNRHHKPK